MPALSFIYPGALWLLLLLIPLWLLALLAPRRLSPLRFWFSLGLRTVLVLLLVLSLAGTQIVHGVEHVTTVFLIDSSDSVSPAARSQAEAFVQQALNARPADDRAAIVLFGSNALVERVPSELAFLGRLSSQPLAARTNIEEAIQLGLALLPAETQKRIVLLSDGGENSGDAQQAASLAAARNVPIEIVDLGPGTASDEALITGLAAPTSAREGQEVELVASVESSVAQSARLRVLDGQRIIFDEQVRLEAGANSFRITTIVEGQGFRRYRASIEPEYDGRVQNNEVATLVRVQGPPRVLLVAERAADAANLRSALSAAGMLPSIVAPDAIPDDLEGLSSYEAVMLVNVPARSLPIGTMRALPSYVRDLGRGLAMVGGTDSYGVGGYGKTPVEDALPVYMDVRDRQQRPDLALIFVIDKSGSMDACHCNSPDRSNFELDQGGERKIDIAKEAVAQAAALLRARDTLGIVTFDTVSDWALPATMGASVAEVAEAMADVAPRGNTNVRAGLRAAEDVLATTNARIKHVVLLTDGWGSGGSNLDIAQRMNDNGITLSVVAAGAGSANFLENLALTGGGRYYASVDMSDVPEIFLQETIVAVGNYIIERPVFPRPSAASPILRGIDAKLPPVYGYNGSTLKETAQTVLVADDGAPLLAKWQFGLGRSIAWLSDTQAHWGTDLVQWEQFPRFAAQMVGWVLPAEESQQQMTTEIRVEGGQATIIAQTQDTQGRSGEQVTMSARLLPSNLRGVDELDAAREVELRQVAPGDYRATLSDPTPGTYLVQVRGHVGDGVVSQAEAGLVVPYSSEYRPDQNDPELLAALARMTGGSPLDDPAQAFAHDLNHVTQAQEVALPLLLLALLLLPFDIASRRVLLQRRDMQRARQWLGQQRKTDAAEQTASPTMERLAQARNRAFARGSRQAAPPSEAPPAPADAPDLPAPTPEPAPEPTQSSTFERLAQARNRAVSRTSRRAPPPTDDPPEPPGRA
jgi:uncharacterized membrane protein